jgi:hypothetical protein
MGEAVRFTRIARIDDGAAFEALFIPAASSA